MKLLRFPAIIMAVSLFAGASTASAQARHYERALSREALKWEHAYLAMSAVDLAQTVYCLERGQCTEANPLFGKRPRTEVLIFAKMVGSSIQYALFTELRRRDPKMALRVAQVSFGLQGAVVALNMRVVF